MMHYQYRWLYAIVLNLMLTAAAYYYDMRDKFMRVAELQQTENEIRTKFVGVKSLANPKWIQPPKLSSVETSELTSVSALVNLAHINGLSIQAIKVVSTDEARMIHFIVQGQFQSLYSFIFTLEREANLAEIQHFSCGLTQQQQLQMQADILLHNSVTPSFTTTRSHSLKIDNPFCASTHINGWAQGFSLTQMQSTSIRLMKMVGYLHQEQRTQALILLPNTDLVAIQKGSILGKEQATVTDIQPNLIKVELQNKSQYRISSELGRLPPSGEGARRADGGI